MKDEQIIYRKTLPERKDKLYVDELVNTSEGTKERVYALKPSKCIPVNSEDWEALLAGEEIMLQNGINRSNGVEIQRNMTTGQIDYVSINYFGKENQAVSIYTDNLRGIVYGGKHVFINDPEREVILKEAERKFMEIKGKFSMISNGTITDGCSFLEFLSSF